MSILVCSRKNVFKANCQLMLAVVDDCFRRGICNVTTARSQTEKYSGQFFLSIFHSMLAKGNANSVNRVCGVRCQLHPFSTLLQMGKAPKKRSLADKVRKTKTATEIKNNPFEVKINRKKFDILGRKTKHDVGLPGVSRSKAITKVRRHPPSLLSSIWSTFSTSVNFQLPKPIPSTV